MITLFQGPTGPERDMHRRSRRERVIAWTLLSCATLTGCGAAYYGTAIGIIATQKDEETIDLSFPDAVTTAPVAPTFASVTLSTTQVTLDRNLSAFNPGGVVGTGTVQLTDFEIESIDFPPGYGESRSNRDAGTAIEDGDRLVIRINGDTSRELLFDATDAAAGVDGPSVALTIRDKVRLLTPQDPDVPLEAYTEFEGSFDPVSGSYLFTSGAPGEASEVLFEPSARLGTSDEAPDATSTETAARLGLGEAQGGLELGGAESVRFSILNRGTDAVVAGTTVELFLSHDKVLDRTEDLPFDRVGIDATVAVGEVRQFSRRNGNAPPARLLRQDLTPGLYYVLFSVNGNDPDPTNDMVPSLAPVLVSLPYDDPAAPPGGPQNAVDIVAARTVSPIAVVTGQPLSMAVTLSNVGGDVLAPGVPVDMQLVLSDDAVFDVPGGFLDPTGVVPVALRINSDDPNRSVTVELDDTLVGGVPLVSLNGQTVTVRYDPTLHTVAEVTAQLLARANGLLDAFTTGPGNANAVLMETLALAAATDTTTTGDTYITDRTVTFSAEPQPLRTQTFVLDGEVRVNSFRTNLLPSKLIPIVRIDVDNGVGNVDNAQNNIRPAANYVRVYDRNRATFDATTTAILPTVNQDDFATLDAVTQRPVNAGSIRQGQQRVLRFELPATGLTVEESQLLVILRTTNFDAHIDLLNATGAFITGSDDSGLGKDPVIYTSVQATPQMRAFYVLVSTARSDEADLVGGSETFELTISINQRQVGDTALVAATRVLNVVTELPQAFSGTSSRSRNDILAPLVLSNGKAEVGFVLPQRARVRFTSRPLFDVGVATEITGFVGGFVPFPVEHQAVLDSATGAVVYRPTGGTVETSHVLEAGVYTFSIESLGGVDSQALRLELDTLFIPD